MATPSNDIIRPTISAMSSPTVPFDMNFDVVAAIQSSIFTNSSIFYEPTSTPKEQYDYVLKFLLVGDSDVGKEEFLQNLEDDDSDNSSTEYRSLDVAYKSTSILLYGKQIKLHIWFDILNSFI